MQVALSESLQEKVKAFLSDVDKKRRSSEKRTRAKARVLFNEYCKKIRLMSRPPFPVTPEVIIKDILKVDYSEPETIPAANFTEVASGKSRVEIAGLIDRKNRRIVIARKFDPDWKRFTAAHEIGHWLLHPEVILLRERPVHHESIRLRERPMTGHELAYDKRPPAERQADLFAAELLMPTSYLVETFFYRFGGPIDGTEPNQGLAFWLSATGTREVDPYEFSKWSKRGRSRLIAQVSSFGGNHFISLSKCFGVSLAAMAIQLEDLGLVK